MERYPCDTCGRLGTLNDMNGCQCWDCYTPDGPYLLLDEWEAAGRQPERFTRMTCYCTGPIRPDTGCPRHGRQAV